MNRIEIIYDILCNRGSELESTDQINDLAMNAEQISKLINIDRSNTSRYLNILAKEGRVIKLDGRPVRFIEKNIYEELSDSSDDSKVNRAVIIQKDPFETLIGANVSLKQQVEQAKSAVLYPPVGLHTLLTGPTGTGKSTFAEKIYDYAIQMKTINPNAKFVVFNCAEYAENPQLVMSQLFGHKKGAFTGADTEKKGLIDEAEGGIILLDEIHRLSPDCQELLFMLMDKGVFRRLGETDASRTASVLIIGATTENIDEALLRTFIRRMPITINLPPLKERPLPERLQLIETLLMREQKNIDAAIKLHKDALIALLLYDCIGNVGQLKADVQLICARGFLNYKVHELEYVDINVSTLPEHIQKGLLLSREKNDLIEFIKNSDEYHSFDKADKDENIVNDSKLVVQINEKYNAYAKKGRSIAEISHLINSDLEVYLNEILDKYPIIEKDLQKDNLLKIVDTKIYEVCEDAINYAEMKLGRSLSDRVRVGMIMHINSMITKPSNGAPIDNKKINEIVLNHPKEFKIAKFILVLLEENLNTKIPMYEVGFLTMLLCVTEENHHDRIGVIVIAHGESTASSMADFVNKLLDTNHCKALDMPMDMSVDKVFDAACTIAEKVDEGKGVILLVDMGSLGMMGEMISKKTNINISTIEMVSTLTVIEAVRKAILKDTDLDSLTEDLTNIYHNLVDSGIGHEINETVERTIITSCLSGKGVALKVENIIRESINLGSNNITIEHFDLLSAENAYEKVRERGIENVIAVVGTVDLQLQGTPYIPIDELIVGNGLNLLGKLIHSDALLKERDRGEEIISDSVVRETLKNILTFLDPTKASKMLIDTYNGICEDLALEKSKDVFLRFIMHSGCMLERVLNKEPLTYPDVEAYLSQYKMEHKVIQNRFKHCETLFNIVVPGTEIAYILDILK